MTRRQWMWLWVWLLLFFIIFCVWDKLQSLTNNTKEIVKPTAKTVVAPVQKQMQQIKDINLKVVKDEQSIKISGVFSSKEELENLKKEYEKISTDVKEGMIVIDKNAQNTKITRLFPILTEDFSKFKSGYLEYNNGKFTIDGIVNDEKVKLNIGNKVLNVGNILVDNKVILEKTKESPIKAVEPKKVVKKVSKKEIQTKLDNLFKITKVEFVYAKDLLTPKGKKTIDKVYTILNKHKNIKVEVGGHTDSDGTKKLNKALSQKRANAIKKYLITKGIKSNRLKAVGYGESKPLVKNDSSKNKQINRRVEFKITGE